MFHQIQVTPDGGFTDSQGGRERSQIGDLTVVVGQQQEEPVKR